MAARSIADGRSVFARLRERLRYGLLTQELLDRLARAGILYYPYYLVKEGIPERLDLDAPGPSISFSKLEVEQAPLVAGMPCRSLDVEAIVRRMTEGVGYGVFEGDALIGYTWASFSGVVTAIGRDTLFKLDDTGAYLYDMYVAKAHRGKRLAPWLRRQTHEALASLGRRELYSLSLAHNESTRRFKARLGAVEIEKRLAVGVRRVFGRDLRLRSLVDYPLSTQRSMPLRGWVRNI